MNVRQQRTHDFLVKMIHDAVGIPESGAEIGVYEGELSQSLRIAFPACELLLVDPWQAWGPDDSYWQKHRRSGSFSQEKWDNVYTKASQRIKKMGGRNRVMRTTSRWAAKVTANDSLSFIFIDADHSFDMVKQDIEIWMPKLHKGGLICGHDYGLSQRGVQRAVHDVLGKDDLILPGERTQLWGYVI